MQGPVKISNDILYYSLKRQSLWLGMSVGMLSRFTYRTTCSSKGYGSYSMCNLVTLGYGIHIMGYGIQLTLIQGRAHKD